jgi:mannose-6-phosphate isomerase-like protein (cupin superfamily)
VSWDAAWEAQAFLDRETGKTYLVSDAIDMDEALEELPDDLDSERYLEIPRRSELDLGKPLVLAFVAERLPGELDRVEGMFRRRGAYRRYKDLLEERGLLDAWHAFEEQAEKRALVEWCQEQGIEVTGWAEDPSVSRARTGSLTAGIPRELPEELAEVLVGGGATRVERIVSRGHASAPGFWYDQDQAELVLLVQGRGAVELEGHEEPIVLGPGDWLDIPAHCRHRVAWTDAGQDTIWLAVFYTQ